MYIGRWMHACAVCAWINGQVIVLMVRYKYEPLHEETCILGFQPSPTQTGLYSHRRWLEAGNFRFRKERNCTIHGAKTKALISFAVTAKHICVFVLVYVGCLFSCVAAHMGKERHKK